jgi:hypothetical protein
MRSPTARPTAWGSLFEIGCSTSPSGQITAAKDSPSSHSSRISSRQLDDIVSQLSDHDRSVLRFVSEVRLASGKQLVRRFWLNGNPDNQGRVGRRALKRLTEWRILDVLPRRVGGVRAGSDGLIYGVGVAGSRLLQREGFYGKRLGTPGARYVDHTLAVTELVVRLSEADASGQLDLITTETEPTCWRGFLGPMGARSVLKPDLFVRIGVGAYEDRWLFEVDRATEASGTLIGKAKRYLSHYRSGSEQAAHGVYPRIMWTVPDARRAGQVTEALSRLPAESWRLFSVCLFDQVIEQLAAEARS